MIKIQVLSLFKRELLVIIEVLRIIGGIRLVQVVYEAEFHYFTQHTHRNPCFYLYYPGFIADYFCDAYRDADRSTCSSSGKTI